MDTHGSSVLVIGYGNPGRLDDGLGPALADALERLKLPGVTVDSDYQLAVEDARAVADHDVVVFADASLSGPAPFTFCRIAPKPGAHFSSHIVEPEGVLALARELFGAQPEAYVLGIRGYVFDDFGERLSEQARANLAAALAFIERVLRERSFHAAEAATGKGTDEAAGPSSGDGRCKTASM
jgi:hydrogenase maturation protease